MSLSELITPSRRVAYVGLAKSTGKTEALACTLRELRARGHSVGVTSVGRDGEACDAIDGRIAKPRIELPAWSLVASTDALLRSCAVAHEPLVDTDIRTPLGRVVVARLLAAGTVEVAGPSAAGDVRAVADAMLAHGAEQVLIDGALDRRAASSPAVSDGVVMSTGAVLHEEIQRVVACTRTAASIVRLAELDEHSPVGRRIRALARTRGESMLIGDPDERPRALPPRFTLRATRRDIAALLAESPRASHLLVRGALCEPFVDDLRRAARGRELQLTVADSTKVFLSHRDCSWYERQGIAIRVLKAIRLRALTVNPVAPRSHRFDSAHLRELLQAAIPGVPIIDVRERSRDLASTA
jgi:hypothetical protein